MSTDGDSYDEQKDFDFNYWGDGTPMDANGNPKVFFKGDTEEDMFENMTDEYVSDEDLSFTDEEDESTEKNVEGQHQPDPFPFLNLPEELQTEVFRKKHGIMQSTYSGRQWRWPIRGPREGRNAYHCTTDMGETIKNYYRNGCSHEESCVIADVQDLLCYIQLSTKDWNVVRLVSRYMRDFLERHWTSLPPRRMLPMVAGGSCNISMRICRAFDQDLYNCTKVAEILRYARAAFVPAVSINQVRITPTLIKRLTKSVMESQVKVSQWHFGYGSISCGVEEMVNLLKLCKTGTLKIVVPFADIQFCEALSRHPFIQTINVVLLVIESSLMHEMSIIPMEKFTLEQLGRMLRIWEYKDGVFFLYMRPSQRLGKDVPFMLRCAEPNHRVIDGRHILTNYHGCQMEMKNENGALTCFRLDI